MVSLADLANKKKTFLMLSQNGIWLYIKQLEKIHGLISFLNK